MSNAEKLGNVEDVLSSIRRLVADGQVTTPEQPQDSTPILLKEVDIIEIKSTESVKPQDVPKNMPAEPTKRLASFVETMNASIAKITTETHVEKTPAIETESQKAQNGVFQESAAEENHESSDAPVIDAPVEASVVDEQIEVTKIDESVEMADADVPVETDEINEPVEATNVDEPIETEEPTTVTPIKPAPYILQSAIVTEPEVAEETTEITDALDAAPTDEENTPVETEASFQVVHDEEAEEITIPEDIEDDEAALARETDATDQPAAHFIDEDALREIVSELVRAELQGDLGDRITRNVRKLVRREIHSALANRELE
jgi:hypothetical protein